MTTQSSSLAERFPAETTIDFTAAGLSGLCFLHCLVLPLLASVLPTASIWAEAEWAHKAFVLMAIPISGYAAFASGVHHRSHVFAFFVSFGLALLVVSAFVEGFHGIEKLLTATGAFIVATSHLWRWRRHYNAEK